MAKTREIARCLLRHTVACLMLVACSPAVPLRLTPATEIGVTASTPVISSTTPLTVPSATPISTTFESSPTTRIAIVDQSSAVDTSRAGWWSIKTLGPVGQTFKPAFAGLDTIALWTEDQWDAECSGVGASLQAELHEAKIDGPLLASSRPVILPDCFKGITFFDFPSLIPLTPDKAYVIEVIITSGDNWGVVWQQLPDSYPRGESIVLGAVIKADLEFQEGLRNSTPLTREYCQDNLWQHVKRADGSAFSDQGDCIQYVNSHQ